jgi:hypothetical protein
VSISIEEVDRIDFIVACKLFKQVVKLEVELELFKLKEQD